MPDNLLKRHRVVRQIQGDALVLVYCICLAVVGALDYWDDTHIRHYICNLVIFQQLAIFIYRFILAPEPLFAHELERKNDVTLRVDAKHVADQKAALNLVLRHVKYVTCARLGFNCQQYAVNVVDSDDVWQAGTASAQTSGMPNAVVESLDQRMLIRIAPAASDVSQSASVEQPASLKFLKEQVFYAKLSAARTIYAKYAGLA